MRRGRVRGLPWWPTKRACTVVRGRTLGSSAGAIAASPPRGMG
jgi:hypothetical protein